LLEDLLGGGVRLTLDVVVDWGLEAWILGFGPAVRVLQPESLVSRLVERLSATAALYQAQGGSNRKTVLRRTRAK